VLGHEDAPPPTRPAAQPRPMLGEGIRSPWNADDRSVPQGAPVAAGLESKGVRGRDAVSVIEVEGHDVERAPVVLGTTAS
jgi:hypothetical protein